MYQANVPCNGMRLLFGDPWCPLRDQRLESIHSLFDVLAAIESAQPEVSFTAGSKATPGGTYEMRLLQQLVEEIPA